MFISILSLDELVPLSLGRNDLYVKQRLLRLLLKMNEEHAPNFHKLDIKSIVIGFLFGLGLSVLISMQEVYADEINVNLTSWHSDTSYKYNNKNYGLGYTKDFDHHWQGKVGFYENSYKKQSTYLMANLKHDMKNWRWGVQFGFVTGYDDIELPYKNYSESHDDDDDDNEEVENQNPGKVKNLSKFQFIVLPTVTWKATKKHSVTIGYMPSFSKDTFAFATMAYNYTF